MQQETNPKGTMVSKGYKQTKVENIVIKMIIRVIITIVMMLINNDRNVT